MSDTKSVKKNAWYSRVIAERSVKNQEKIKGKVRSWYEEKENSQERILNLKERVSLHVTEKQCSETDFWGKEDKGDKSEQ